MINYNVDDNGILRIYDNNYILAEISDCGQNNETEIDKLITEVLSNLSCGSECSKG